MWYYLFRHRKVFLFWKNKGWIEMKKLAKKIVLFFIGLKNEMKKVKWPSKKEMIKYSCAALTFIIVFAVFFSFTDLLIAGVKTLVEEYL